MSYNKHYNLKGKHAILSPSRLGWENKTNAELLEMYARSKITDIGSAFHDIARKHIKNGIKMRKSSKDEIRLSLIEDYKIPAIVLDNALIFDEVYENVLNYTNDAIRYGMIPEQELCYCEDISFGTADAITDVDEVFEHGYLRIHDLKCGKSPTHIEQLMKYAALFCLEYRVRPEDIQVELRIYQNNDIFTYKPEAEEIQTFMNLYIEGTDYLLKTLYSSEVRHE